MSSVAPAIEALDRWHFILNAVLCSLGTLLGVMIGWRQADTRTSRALALGFLWWSSNLGDHYAPAGWPAMIVKWHAVQG